MKKALALFLALVTVLGVMPMAVLPTFATEAIEEQTTYTYDDMYVQGATFKWDAFDMKATDDAITAFVNQVGEKNISLPVAVTMGDGYVLYPYTASSISLASLMPKHQISKRYLPDDYTLEMTVHQHWDESCSTVSPVKWEIAGFGTGSSWGGQFQVTTQVPSETKGTISKVTSMYAVMKEDGTLIDSWENSKTWTSAFTHLLEKPYSVGWVHDATFSDDATYHPSADTPLRDGALKTSLTRNHYLRNVHYDDLNDKGFKIGAYVSLAYYAIRIYPFALSAEQTAQNHFAELCDYYQIGGEALNTYFALDTNAKAALHDSFVGVTYPDTDAAALEEAISEKYTEMIEALYDAVYVQGATFKWDAFDMKATDDVITAFENQVGDKDVSLPVTVTMGNGYILYPQTGASGRFNLTSFVPTKTYEIEGTKYYKADDYSLEMTVHQYWQDGFVTSISPNRIDEFGETSNITGQQQRLFYTFNTDSTTYEEKGVISKVTISPYSTSFGSSWNQTVLSSAFLNGLNKPYSIGVNWDLNFDGTSTSGTFTINSTRDGQANAGKTYGSKLQTALGTFSGHRLYFGSVVPFAYYAIRVYPFALSAEQTAQNHFAELCDYHQVSIEALHAYLSLDEDMQKELHNSFVGVTYPDTDAKAMEAAIFNMTELQKEVETREFYASLYVDGAVFLWNPFLHGTVTNGYLVNLLDGSMKLGDGTATLEEESGYGYAAYAGRLDFTSLIQKADGTYGDALDLEIGLRLTSDYGNIDRFFGPLAHFSNNSYDAGRDNQFTYSQEKRTDGNDSFGMIKSPYRAYPLSNLSSVTYYFKDAQDTAPIAKDAYDALSDQEKNAYTLSAEMPFYEASYHGISFDQTGYWDGHVFGNYTGETYSFGVSMTFDLENHSFDYALLRDGEAANGKATSKSGLLYVPGMALYGATTFIAPTSYEAAVQNTALQNMSFHSWSEKDAGFYFGQASAEYYSIHLYNTALTDMQRKQNHFADLASYFRPHNIDAFTELPEAKKQEIYTVLGEREDLFDNGVTNTSFEDIDARGGRAYIENLIDYACLGFGAESFVSFEGYQVRTVDTVGLRSLYTLKADSTIEGVTLLEVGAIMAVASDRETADLTVCRDGEGNYRATGAQMMSQAVYKNGETVASTFEKDGATHFAYTLLFDRESDTKENLTKDMLFRGYAVVEFDGEEYVLYTDMYGETFCGGALSMYDLSKQEANLAYGTSKKVIETVEAE